MSKTPRTDNHTIGTSVDVIFARQLERELAEARAEIERKDALKLADDLIDEYAADYEHRDNVDEMREEIKAALAAEKEGL